MEVLSSRMSRFLYSNPITAFCLVVLIVACIQFCRSYRKLVRVYENLPSGRLEARLILSVILEYWRKDVPITTTIFLEFMNMCRRFQKEGFCLLWFYRPYLFMFNEEFFKRFHNEPAAVDKSRIYELIDDITGNGLLTRNGDSWRHHRKLLNPVFNVGMLKANMPLFNNIADDVAKKLDKVAGKPTTDLVDDFLKFYSLNIFAETILGLKLSDEKYGSKIVDYFKIVDSGLSNTVSRMVRPWLYSTMSLPFFPTGRTLMKLRDEAQTFTKEILSEMKKSVIAIGEPKEDLDYDEECKKSFTRILLEQHLKDPSFTLKDVEDHITFFVGAGHDTTSYTLMWVFYLLGHHPEVQAKAFSEIETLDGRDVTYEDLCEMKYVESIIKEALRLYPTVPIIARNLSEDIECGNHIIPKGTDVVFFIYMYHRNPDTYPDPDKFDPERFLENSDIRPWKHMPFSEGSRSCIGKKFAMTEMSVCLIHILRRFEIKTLDVLEETDLDWSIVLKSARPARMLFTMRQ